MTRLVSILALWTVGLCATTACSHAPPDPPADAAYRAEIAEWQRKHAIGMKRDWGSLIGLFWLQEGRNTFGSDPGNAIVLPRDRAPAHAGVFELTAGKVTVRTEPRAGFTLNGVSPGAGKPIEAALAPDTSEKPDVLKAGTLTLTVLDREGRFAIRGSDSESPLLASFPELKFFPVRERYKVRGKLVRSAQPIKITFPSVNMANGQKESSPGYVEFELEGKQLRLLPTVEGERLFFVFKDLTGERHQTYPAARFLYATPDASGEMVLDFNRSYNPPCAFTAYATCPLATPENTLPVAIEAGEMFSGH